MTTKEVAAKLGAPRSCALLPVGSTEPHGPHLPLDTDVVISEVACDRAAPRLEAAGVATVVAPALPYGVTDYASGFAGAIGVPAAVLTPMIRAVVERLLADGFRHVCVVNNHLEPAHDAAVRAAIDIAKATQCYRDGLRAPRARGRAFQQTLRVATDANGTINRAAMPAPDFLQSFQECYVEHLIGRKIDGAANAKIEVDLAFSPR